MFVIGVEVSGVDRPEISTLIAFGEEAERPVIVMTWPETPTTAPALPVPVTEILACSGVPNSAGTVTRRPSTVPDEGGV